MTAPSLEARLTIRVGDGDALFAVESELLLDRGTLVLFGPSGAGKTLTVQALAGLLRPTHGWIRVEGETLFDHDARIDVAAHRRRIGYVPQHDSLFPFRNVIQNVSFGLRRAERRRGSRHIAELLDELGIAHLAHAYPASLSGGERQRVALARALAVRPRLLLLDEPFASIDRPGRSGLQRVLLATLKRHALPTVLVTHDAGEARVLGDHVVRFDRGRTIAAGAPAALLAGEGRVAVTGESKGDLRLLEGGEAEIRLESAVVRGPRDILEPPSGPVVRLELEVSRPEAGAPESSEDATEGAGDPEPRRRAPRGGLPPRRRP